jgi:hypothetical protein
MIEERSEGRISPKRRGQQRKFQISPVRVTEPAEAVVSRTNLNNHMRRQACRQHPRVKVAGLDKWSPEVNFPGTITG